MTSLALPESKYLKPKKTRAKVEFFDGSYSVYTVSSTKDNKMDIKKLKKILDE